MQTLYPEIKPYARHELAVEEPHVLYVDESGSPDGLPVLFVHGGPGGGCDALSRRFFDPTLYRIITFDQRGCGRSTPHASLENNTTAHLIADMQRIREHLGMNRPIYQRTAAYGHFGREPEADGGFSWEKTDLVEAMKKLV